MCIPWPILELRENPNQRNNFDGLMYRVKHENIRQISVYDIEEQGKAQRKQKKFRKSSKQKYKQINLLKDKLNFDNDRKWLKQFY